MLSDVKILALHRKIKEKRNKIFNEFKKLEKLFLKIIFCNLFNCFQLNLILYLRGILVCTDILSRGIDIDDVDCARQPLRPFHGHYARGRIVTCAQISRRLESLHGYD